MGNRALCSCCGAQAEMPYLREVSCSPTSVDSVREGVLALARAGSIPQLRRDAPTSELTVTPVTGRGTDHLFLVEGGGCSGAGAVLVRIFAAAGAAERDPENATFAAMAAAGLAPLYWGRFRNGRAEGWLQSYRPATHAELPQLSQEVARSLAALHAWRPPPAVQEHHERPKLWDQMWQWLDEARAARSRGSFASAAELEHAAFQRVPSGAGANSIQMSWIDLDSAERQVRELERGTPFRAPTCMCHNCLSASNIMVNTSGVGGPPVRFAGLANVGVGYSAFDIANHWCEWAGGEEDGEPDYSNFPTEEQQIAFCEAYCAALRAAGGGAAPDPAALAAEARRFVLVAHWYWALWAIVQSAASLAPEGSVADDFPYIKYAERRVGECFRQKALRGPRRV
eukprot:TRINITY_DN17495_c0_g1_i1.p1 TRINITY_DN17495_c0_g1~~TRINITY_DN17495_c0_g1_i1.p1  ORF type:complete len:422 (+),score=84.37 TRINITY_DN17495_c0_g1_i1:74-1267(+)